jgi:hypothetical protein
MTAAGIVIGAVVPVVAGTAGGGAAAVIVGGATGTERQSGAAPRCDSVLVQDARTP